MLVIGSTALARALSKRGMFLSRKPQDIDVICTYEEMWRHAALHNLSMRCLAVYKWQGRPRSGNGPTVEFEILDHSKSGHEYILHTMNVLHHSEIVEAVWNVWDEAPLIYAPLDVLYSIKMAHRHYPRQWKKHAEDRALMQYVLKGVDSLADITKIREKETQEREGKLKTPSLDKTADDFFNDTVSNKVFIHDQIHEVMAHRERPMFEYIKKDASKVACSREKFEALSIEDRARCVLEEAYVIALERHIIPMLFAGGKPRTADEAFDWALMRISTNLCSGWFREFAVMNYTLITNIRDCSYVEKFLKAFEEGKIERIKEAHVETPTSA